ncbi:hypothetical protein L873DRAFT_1871024 [Choiromyces venosus 120613-1]|uniref:Uncharacterized protein n=1 Tax=Choiromyces venosus 120613-1 TaxID=1336337 RepID=A0A3N4K3F8_9PEZI|nr:hypothetical protein L873DRAFT_1871024 [Choiromyces venosus 120613-1]
MPFSVALISFCVVLGFLFCAAYFCFPDQLTIGSYRTIAAVLFAGLILSSKDSPQLGVMPGNVWCGRVEKR